MLPRSGRVGTIHTSAEEVRDRSRPAHGAFYSTISLSGYVYITLVGKGLRLRTTQGPRPDVGARHHAALPPTHVRSADMRRRPARPPTRAPGAHAVARICGPDESVLSITRLRRCGTGRGRPTGVPSNFYATISLPGLL